MRHRFFTHRNVLYPDIDARVRDELSVIADRLAAVPVAPFDRQRSAGATRT